MLLQIRLCVSLHLLELALFTVNTTSNLVLLFLLLRGGILIFYFIWRHLLGEDLGPLSAKELQRLEKQLEVALSQARQRKVFAYIFSLIKVLLKTWECKEPRILSCIKFKISVSHDWKWQCSHFVALLRIKWLSFWFFILSFVRSIFIQEACVY